MQMIHVVIVQIPLEASCYFRVALEPVNRLVSRSCRRCVFGVEIWRGSCIQLTRPTDYLSGRLAGYRRGWCSEVQGLFSSSRIFLRDGNAAESERHGSQCQSEHGRSA